MAEHIHNIKEEDRDIDIDIVRDGDNFSSIIIRIVIYYHKKIGLAMGMEEISDLLDESGPWILYLGQEKQRGNYIVFEMELDEGDL